MRSTWTPWRATQIRPVTSLTPSDPGPLWAAAVTETFLNVSSSPASSPSTVSRPLAPKKSISRTWPVRAFSGRTANSDSVSPGSNPGPPAIHLPDMTAYFQFPQSPELSRAHFAQSCVQGKHRRAAFASMTKLSPCKNMRERRRTTTRCTTAEDHIRVLTGRRPMGPISPRCRISRRRNPGRRFTCQTEEAVQTSGASSLLGLGSLNELKSSG